jgi:hypothetical protein
MPAAQTTKAERELRKHLQALVTTCAAAIDALDAEMKKPSDVNRGKRIAAICNALEFQKDAAKHFGLGVPFKKRRSPQP